MMRKTAISLLMLVLCLCTLQNAQAQTTATAEIEQLQKEMYRYFPLADNETFFQVTDKLKAAALKAGDIRTFYKAWGNQAMYAQRNVGREKGLEIAQKMKEYAQEHDQKFGLYSAAYSIASLQNSMRMYDAAEKSFLESISYLERYFPDESTAPPYLQLAKIYHNQQEKVKENECADKVLADSKTSKLNILTAWSFKCFALLKGDATDVAEFNRCWEEREKVKAVVGHDDTYGSVLNVSHAIMNKQLDKALEFADKMTSKVDRLYNLSRTYAEMGNYKQAYEYYNFYVRLRDSLNNATVKKLALENALQVDVARAESEAKDLRLANQQQELALMESELQQQRLEAQAAELNLKNQQAELDNAAMQLENATLDSKAKELELREAHLMMEAQVQAVHARQLTERFVYITAAIILAALAFFLWRRQRQMKKLKAVHQQLVEAYGRLEETTSVKERIESELRIARDIQMSMVPNEFPQRDNLDIFAYMAPAKEVGGDLYTYDLQGDMFYFCIGDVSGKGVPASLFMAQATRLFRSQALLQRSPAQIANHLNEELSANNEQGMFVTMFIGLLNLQTGKLDFCNCGHNPPVLDTHFMEVDPNAPIGLWPGLEFVGEQLKDIRGKRLFLYTDGLNEAEDAWKNQYSDQLLLSQLKAHPTYGCRQVIEMFKTSVAEHAVGVEPSDDITMMCIKLKSVI